MLLSMASIRFWALLFTISLRVEAFAVHTRDLAQRRKMAQIRF
jgi:hypothetical protein